MGGNRGKSTYFLKFGVMKHPIRAKAAERDIHFPV
jgi:hypothetical protein